MYRVNPLEQLSARLCAGWPKRQVSTHELRRIYKSLVRYSPILTSVFLLLLLWPDSSQAQSGVTEFLEVTSISSGYLAKLFVLAVIVESGLAVLFNWRVFLTYFSLRGFRTLISTAVSWLIVSAFDLNIVRQLLESYSGTSNEPYSGTGFLTALVIAGGSSGVNNLMRSLGYRDAGRDPQLPTTPSRSVAWVSVTVKTEKLASEALIELVREESNIMSPAIAGMCHGSGPSLKHLFFPSNDRFPRAGGYELEPGVPWTIRVRGKDSEGQTISILVTDDPITLAPGAIVDFKVRL